MPSSAPRVITRIKNFQGTAAEHKRAVFALVFLQTRSVVKAARAAHSKPSLLKSIIGAIVDHGDIRERPRSGRPLSYTDEVLEEACRILADKEQCFLTGTTLMKVLVERGIWPKEVNVDLLLKHLKEYCRRTSRVLVVNSTKALFFLKDADAVARVSYATSLLQELEDQQLDNVIFVDETTHEESPHPKGKMY
jgi:hypothetical protein